MKKLASSFTALSHNVSSPSSSAASISSSCLLLGGRRNYSTTTNSLKNNNSLSSSFINNININNNNDAITKYMIDHQIITRNYHTNTSNLFFDLKKAKQQATESAVFSEQEKQELIKNYQLLEDKFKRISEKVVEYRKKYPVPVQSSSESNDLLVEISAALSFCFYTFPKANDPAHIPIRFYKSNIGMKSYVLMKKIELLLLKVVNQEWVPVDSLRTHFDEKKIMPPLSTMQPKDIPIDETFFLFACYDAQLSYAAYIPPIATPDVKPITKENLIAACLFLFSRLKDCPVLGNDLRNYANQIFESYERAKKDYTTAKPITEGGGESLTVNYDAHENAYSYLGKTFTEHEFDYFEDIETNIPIHLGNFFKALKTIIDFDSAKSENLKTIDECIQADPKNIYLHYLKASCLDVMNAGEGDLTVVHNNYSNGVHHLEKALSILSSLAPLLPLPTLSKTSFSPESEEQEKHVERVKDLKFTPINLNLANMYSRAAESGVSTELRHLYGGKGIDCIRQTELYSRYPNSAAFYMCKGSCYYACDMYEWSISSYSAVEQFESVLDPSYLIDSLACAANGMIALGFSDKCLEAMDYYIEKYEGDPRLVFQKILCKDYLSKSKTDLKNALKEFEQLKESVADLAITNPYVYSRVNTLIDGRLNELNATINNPNIAESW